MGKTLKGDLVQAVDLSSVHSIVAPTQVEVHGLASYLTQSTGMMVDQQRLYRLLFKIERRIQELHLSSWSDYIALLQTSHDEFLAFASIMTVNKTHFFREEKHFHILREYVLARLMAGHREKFLVWSAACSTGEEVYSIAMTLDQLRLQFQHAAFTYGVFGTDISKAVLERAQEGIYADQVIRKEVPFALQRQYFLYGKGSRQGLCRVLPEIRSNTKFRLFNLVHPENRPQARFDVIFLRNVLIYFSQKTQMEVIHTVTHHLRPGGLLILGHCERMVELLPQFDSLGNSVYRMKGARA
jgi:chemotaxis protein methyltransferase CheR